MGHQVSRLPLRDRLRVREPREAQSAPSPLWNFYFLALPCTRWSSRWSALGPSRQASQASRAFGGGGAPRIWRHLSIQRSKEKTRQLWAPSLASSVTDRLRVREPREAQSAPRRSGIFIFWPFRAPDGRHAGAPSAHPARPARRRAQHRGAPRPQDLPVPLPPIQLPRLRPGRSRPTEAPRGQRGYSSTKSPEPPSSTREFRPSLMRRTVSA